MIISVVVTVCHLALANPIPAEDHASGLDANGLSTIAHLELCHEEVIMEAEGTLQACILGQPELSDWKVHSRFAGMSWQIKRWRCIPGHYVVKDAI